MSSPGKLHAIAAPIQGGIRIVDQTLVVQFEVHEHFNEIESASSAQFR